MAKDSPSFKCTSCNARTTKWAGRCESCGAWNTIVEDTGLSVSGPSKQGMGGRRGKMLELTDLKSMAEAPPRTEAGVAELDRVLGGGLVHASAVLLGGDPGIGKSTLLLQAAARFARNGLKVIYVTGEESAAQVQLRAQRLGLADSPVLLASESNLRDILTTLEAEKPDLAIIDSIQTVWIDTIESPPGSVSQVRASAHELVNMAKRRGISTILVGHVTKEGALAGPRVVEHMVDTVLYFEGERGHQFRILRAVKNRFGPADEIGVFEMTGRGLAEVKNPSALFLSERGKPTPGSAVFAGIEGTRPILCEIQALVSPAPQGQSRRAVVGWDGSRLSMLLAVLESRAGVSFAGLDVYLNVAGGLRVTEPGADLAVAAALMSARENHPLGGQTVFFGEISLSGGGASGDSDGKQVERSAKTWFHQRILAPHGQTQRGAGHRAGRSR
ncbi:DNA repair protein RadA [Ketogulonicigenium vulgare]|uniref:DNA repair protein RadA n=1 Tax=Ketogulonicigenium vulgare TaxID=92945 RepID=UPI0008AA5EF9|nr:DNA repair protein RadA [Ketogulonicigenium vulgare]AOZ54252.1 DNA repair protein RadA [Ketogulonicigenium vulgare]